jgi:hypothetical protein
MDEQSELVSAIDVAVHEMNQRFRDLFPWIYMLQPNRRRKYVLPIEASCATSSALLRE